MTESLVSRLEGAEAGSRELDFWIAFELGLLSDVVRDRPSRVEPGPGDELTIYDANGRRAGWVGYHVSTPVTTSIDAALSLAGRVLPGWAWNVCGPDRMVAPDDRSWAAVAAPEMNGALEPWDLDRETHEARAATPALALCAAILRAKGTDQ